MPIEANNRHLLVSKKIIENRYRRVGGDGISPSTLDPLSSIEQNHDLNLEEISPHDAGSSRPVVIIGDVGVGKTSFFENLYEKLDQSEKANTYFIHINLGIKANLSDNLKDYVLAEIPRVLRDVYDVDVESADFASAVHYQEMRRFDNSVKGKLKVIDNEAYQRERIHHLDTLVSRPSEHLQASIGHLSRGRGKRVILVVDNADQRSIEVQQEAFLIAQELAATRNLLVFVALRPSTFYASKTTGALSAYQNTIFTISPPPAGRGGFEATGFCASGCRGESGASVLVKHQTSIGQRNSLS